MPKGHPDDKSYNESIFRENMEIIKKSMDLSRNEIKINK